MKFLSKIFPAILLLTFLSLSSAFGQASKGITGSWQLTKGNATWLMMAADNYVMVTHYDLAGKKFYKTFGGFQMVQKGKLQLNYRFYSNEKTKTGTVQDFSWVEKNGKAESNLSGEAGQWVKVGEANNEMTGVWRITKRKEGNEIKALQLAPRRTLKFLTNDRFQWAAINIETGEFSGTGGGTYTFKNGVYAETIEFFSRDDSRVGMTLEFKDKLEGKDWIHTGVSSKGDPIWEVWSKTTAQER